MFKVQVDVFPNNEVRQTLTKVRVSSGGSVRVPPVEPDSPGGSEPLTLLLNSEPPQEPKCRKPTTFGNNAKRAILRSGGALDRVIGSPGEVIFLTGTIPGSTPMAYQAMADYAHLVVDRLKSWLSKRCCARYEFYVWELQKRGALHLHYAVHLPNEKQRQSVLNGFRAEWCRLLRMVGKLGNCNMFQRGFGDYRIHGESVVQAYAQPVRKSVTAYLAKYCSKEAGKLSVCPHPYAPKRWWGRSRPLKSLTDSLTKTFWLTFSKLSLARSFLSSFHDDMEKFSVKAYAYRHYCGVGETTLNYVLPNLWKEGLNWMLQRLNGTPSAVMVRIMLKSRLLSMLHRLTANFLALSRQDATGRSSQAEQLLLTCKVIQSSWQDSNVDCLMRWVDALCKLSVEFPAGRYLKMSPSYWDNPSLHPVSFLWKTREFLWTFHNPSWEDIKNCENLLDKLGFVADVGTNSVKTGGTQVDPNENSRGSNSCRQLELL